MERRRLGNSGLEVAPLAFGGNVFGWTADEATSFALLDGFVAGGGNLIDTADAYSIWVPGHKGGESETVIGNWLKKRGGRDRVIIATKAGWDIGAGGKGLSKAHINKSIELSLRRLKTDYVDLYQAHRDDPDAPLEETMDAFAGLVAQGKVRAIGASNYGAPRLAQALAVSDRSGLPRFQSLQPLYNLVERAAFESELEPLCLKEGLGVIPYYSLASGFLTGKYRSEKDLGKSPRGGGVKKYLNERGLRVLTALDEIAARLKATQAQVALAWLMARPSVTAPIASATSAAQLQELLGAMTLKLDRDAIGQLNRASG